MVRIHWHKVIGDLIRNRSRAILTIIAITVGITGMGTVFFARTILFREIHDNYMATNPASAIIQTAPIRDDLYKAVLEVPGILDIEARGRIEARIMVGKNEWKTLWLFVIKDFENIPINRFWKEDGKWPPGPGEILLERVAFRVAGAKIGDQVLIRIPDLGEKELLISGSTHDPGQAPAWMENWVYGYITPETLKLFGQAFFINELNLVLSDPLQSKASIRQKAKDIKRILEERGVKVLQITIPTPGKHPHQDQMDSLLFLLMSFGLLSLLLSCVLIINLISSMMAQQIRQIGVMKAIGAGTKKIVGIYLRTVLILGLIALMIGIPLSVLFSRMYAHFAAHMLNFNIMNTDIPLSYFLIITLVGLLVPVLSSLYPIYRGSVVSVRQAISDYGISYDRGSSGIIAKIIGMLPWLTRPLRLSLGNTFRRKGRMILTLCTLAAGGAFFMASINVGASISKTTEIVLRAYKFDIMLTLNKPAPEKVIQEVVLNTEGVKGMEGWGKTKGALQYQDDTLGNPFTIVTPKGETRLIKLPIIEGRWLLPSEKNGMVVNHLLADQEREFKVGNIVTLKIGNEIRLLNVVGIVKQIGTPPRAFVNDVSLIYNDKQRDYAQNLLIVTEGKDSASHRETMRRLEGRLKEAGFSILSNRSTFENVKILEDHFLIIVTFLMLMSFLMVIVGGLGLISTMGIQIIERTREIGVMRAIGASNKELILMILVEGCLIGIMSWIVSAIATYPISRVINTGFGEIFLHIPLDFRFYPAAPFIWLGLVIIFTVLASYIPARRATRVTVRETLAYE